MTASLYSKWAALPAASWMDRGNCKGKPVNDFFPPNGHNLLTRPAIESCNNCPVQMECLNYAIEHNIDHGIWGGTSENERRRIRKARNVRLRLALPPLSPPESSHG